MVQHLQPSSPLRAFLLGVHDLKRWPTTSHCHLSAAKAKSQGQNKPLTLMWEAEPKWDQQAPVRTQPDGHSSYHELITPIPQLSALIGFGPPKPHLENAMAERWTVSLGETQGSLSSSSPEAPHLGSVLQGRGAAKVFGHCGRRILFERRHPSL